MAGGHEKDIFRQLQETMLRLEAFEKRHEADIRALRQTHRQEIEQIEEKHRAKEEVLREIIATQAQTIKKQETEILRLKQINELLLGEVDRLKSIINNDSSNSSHELSGHR